MKNNQKLKVKRNIQISSLEAAICNVALFKTMKQKEFKDSIFISYNENGVMLQAINQKQWTRANQYIKSFIKNKEIKLLTYGHDKEKYQEIINKDLKQYTKQLKERQQQCPYINLIHYQRLRKSCEYMDKQKYVEPLQSWEKKNKITPNFAFLVVQPKQKFENIKIAILEMLKGNQMVFRTESIKPKQFLHLFYNSKYQLKLRQLFEKKELELKCEENNIIMAIYVDLELINLDYIKVLPYNKKLTKSGFPIIKNDIIRKQIAQSKQFFPDQTNILSKMHQRYIKKYDENYCFIIYSKSQEAALNTTLQVLFSESNVSITKQLLKKQVVCQYSQFQFIEKNYSTQYYTSHIAIINQCHMIVHEYSLVDQQLQGFRIYLEQLSKYYNSSLVRYYGICINENKYYIILDHKQKSLEDCIKNYEFIDEIQVATMILQILYAINFLHTHQEPRCLGILDKKTIFLPTCFILPYLRDVDDIEYSFENDIKIVGQLFDELLFEANQQIEAVISEMLEQNSFKRIKINQLILKMQDIINK